MWDVPHPNRSLASPTLPFVMVMCLFQVRAGPSDYTQERSCVTQTQTQLPAWSWDSDSLPTCHVSNGCLFLRVTKILELFVMEDSLLNLLKHPVESQKMNCISLDKISWKQYRFWVDKRKGAMCSCHQNKVRRLATSPDPSNTSVLLYWL